MINSQVPVALRGHLVLVHAFDFVNFINEVRIATEQNNHQFIRSFRWIEVELKWNRIHRCDDAIDKKNPNSSVEYKIYRSHAEFLFICV